MPNEKEAMLLYSLRKVRGVLSLEKDSILFQGKVRRILSRLNDDVQIEIPLRDLVYAKSVGKVCPRLELLYTENSKAKSAAFMQIPKQDYRRTLEEWAILINKKGKEKKEQVIQTEGRPRVFGFKDVYAFEDRMAEFKKADKEKGMTEPQTTKKPEPAKEGKK